jgi:hypothetical protein
MQRYSDYFKTLHDETQPTGHLGRGPHYSILRAVVWQDQYGRPLSEGQYLDFAIVWDEDHDVRIIEAIETLYLKGLLSPAIIFGERKGSLTVVMPDDVRAKYSNIEFQKYLKKVKEFGQVSPDYWQNNVTTIDDDYNEITCTYGSVLYLKNLQELWKLGVKEIPPKTTPEFIFPELTT